MRVAILNNVVPFLHGGAEILASSLARELERRDHLVELVRLPFSWNPVEHVFDSMMAASLVRLTGVDRAIALKFPAYLVPHDQKVLWLLHQFRQFYDMWDSPMRGYEETEHVLQIRELVRQADEATFESCRAIYVNSGVTQDRMRRFNNQESDVLHPPLPNPEQFHRTATGDYLFAGGRINASKRQRLIVEAMRHTRSDVKLVVAGPPETEDDLKALEQARAASGVSDRIRIIPRMISEAEKADLVNGALGCVYCPVDEDSYGYVTLEGAQASKALITTDDSGGVTDLVIDEETGYVRGADPESLATAFDALARHPGHAEVLGDRARSRVDEYGLSWDHVVTTLLK